MSKCDYCSVTGADYTVRIGLGKHTKVKLCCVHKKELSKIKYITVLEERQKTCCFCFQNLPSAYAYEKDGYFVCFSCKDKIFNKLIADKGIENITKDYFS